MKLLLAALLGLSLVALVAAGLAGLQGDDAPATATDSPPAASGEPVAADPGSDARGTDSPDGAVAAAPDEVAVSGPQLRPLPPAGGVPDPAAPEPRPVALRIPTLDVVDSPVRPVGVETNGEFEVPIASEVGWYRFGSGPGETGSTVMAAHIAYDGENGVFRDLSTIELGALVEVDLDDGSTISYEIVERAEYDKTDLPFADIFSESGPDRLVLITCGGEFNPQLRSYESNVVAYAQPLG